jgi:hypothetical protein
MQVCDLCLVFYVDVFEFLSCYISTITWGLRQWMCWIHFYFFHFHFSFIMQIICWSLCWTFGEISTIVLGLCGTWSGSVDWGKIWLWNFDGPLLLIVYNSLTPTPFVVKSLDVGLPKLGIFGTLTSIEKTTMGLQRIELSFYRWIAMPNEVFNWWTQCEH